MSYSSCKTCFKTIHNSDLESSGTLFSDCGPCGRKCATVDTDTDGDVFVAPLVSHFEEYALNSRHRMVSDDQSNSDGWEDSISPSADIEYYSYLSQGDITVTEVEEHEDGGATYDIEGLTEDTVQEFIRSGLESIVEAYPHTVANGEYDISEDITVTISATAAQKCLEAGFINAVKKMIIADQLRECLAEGNPEEECMSQADRKRSNMMNVQPYDD